MYENSLWLSILILIADTTNVNVGNKTRVVNRLQQMFKKNGKPRPKFLCCQHHSLDRIFRLVMDNELQCSTKSPDVDYFFVKDLMSIYEQLKEAFTNGEAKIKDTGGWRDDIKFLHHLTSVFQYFIEKDETPFANFQQIPNISNAH